MRREAIVAALVASFTLPAAGQVHVVGAVLESGGSGSPQPVPGAHVMARSGSPERVVAEAETDSQGRYRITGLPAGRVTFSVRAQGYYTVRAGDLESESIARSCPAQGDCGETQFTVARAAVIEGWLTDSYGDPYQDIQLMLQPEGADFSANPAEMRRRMSMAVSDDRGYFRIWDVRPGRYELTTRVFPTGPGGGAPLEIEKQTIEIAPGQTRHEARIAVQTDRDVFSISGEIEGVETEGRRGAAISLQRDDYEGPTAWFPRHELLRGNRFAVRGLPRGTYVLRLVRYQEDERQWAYLGELDVTRDLTDLKLSPAPPTGIRGSVEFVDSPKARVFIGLKGGDRWITDSFDPHEPDYEFENSGLAPGEYELEIRGQDYFVLDAKPVTVSLGQMRDIVLRVSNQFATVRGSARLAGGDAPQAAAHFTVGLRGERGRHKIQADDAGGFVFTKIVPGDYEIGAWREPDVDIGDEEAWKRAGENRKRVTLEPGFETEISLTVTP